MISKFLLLLGLTVIAVPCNGHQAIFVHDADGDRMGELIDDIIVQDINLLTSDGFIMTVDTNTGKFRTYPYSGFHYESDDCTGQAYLSGGTQAGPFLGGGHIIEINNAQTIPSFARIDYFPTHVGINVLSSGKPGAPGACAKMDFFDPDVIAVTPVESPAYYIKQIGIHDWGFKKPFSVVREQSGAIFCNGFESCPEP